MTHDSDASLSGAGSLGTAVQDVIAEADDPSPFADIDLPAWTALESLGRALHVKEADLPKTLEAVLDYAIGVIDGARFAGLNLFVKGKFEPQAVVGNPPHSLDMLQKQTRRGPCIDASREQSTIAVIDMRTESRWPEYVASAVELDVMSMLCVPLWVDEQRLGSLSLYGTEVAAFNDQAHGLAGLLATHGALALADAQRTTHLRLALANRDVIGQAKGVLMERHRLTADQAFQLLSQASQNSNRKLADVADALCQTGALPGE